MGFLPSDKPSCLALWDFPKSFLGRFLCVFQAAAGGVALEAPVGAPSAERGTPRWKLHFESG